MFPTFELLVNLAGGYANACCQSITPAILIYRNTVFTPTPRGVYEYGGLAGSCEINGFPFDMIIRASIGCNSINETFDISVGLQGLGGTGNWGIWALGNIPIGTGLIGNTYTLPWAFSGEPFGYCAISGDPPLTVKINAT